MTRPLLIVVSGHPGSGKTTLAHELAAALRCPAVCRDEIKEGMACTEPGYEPQPGDELDRRTLVAFFDAIRVLLEHGVTVVAEAAFQDHVWTPNLMPFADRADLRVVQCHTERETTKDRIRQRAGTRSAHADQALHEAVRHADDPFGDFRRLAIDAPTVDVDTTAGYEPALADIVAFVRQPVR